MSHLPLAEPQPVERADAARNRRAILRAVAALLECGPEAVTMSAVAERAGVGAGTVYRRFGSRDGLLMALLDDQEREFQQEFMAGPPPLGPGAPADVRVSAFADRLLERYRTEGAMRAMLSRRRNQEGAPFGVWRTHLRQLLAKVPGVDEPDVRALLILAQVESAVSIDHAGHDAAAVAGELHRAVQDLVAPGPR